MTFVPCINALAVGLAVLAPKPKPARQTVAFVPTTFEGDADRSLAKRIRAAVGRGNYELVVLEGECEDTDCWRATAKEAGAFLVVVPQVRVLEADHEIEIQTLSVGDGSVVSRVDDTCDLCGKAELLEMGDDLGERVRRTLDRLAGKPGILAMTSTPAGATVYIDGEEIGTTPLDHTMDPGTHEIRLAHPGHEDFIRTVDVVGGTRETTSFRLTPVRPVDPPPAPATRADEGPDGARAMVGAGAGLLAAGVVGIAVGAALVAVHGRPILSDCSEQNIDADGDCRFLRNTRGGGIAMLVVGGVSLVTGAVLLGVGLKRRASRRRASVDGAGLTVSF